MKYNKWIFAATVLLLALLTSACGQLASPGNNASNAANSAAAGNGQSNNSQNSPANNADSSANQSNASNEENASDPNSGAANTAAPEGGQNAAAPGAPASDPAQGDSAAGADDGGQQILIIIDQTPKPTTETLSFDFSIQKVPEGYSLYEMKWVSDNYNISNTPQEALQNGQNGGDGFYISGDGQFTGFFYPEDMKGKKGEVQFFFQNDKGQKLSWKKEITLK